MIILAFCDSKPGGAPSIVVRVSEELASRRIPCAVLDVPWGFVWNTLKGKEDGCLHLVNIEGRRNLDGIVSEQDTVVAFNDQVFIYASSFARTNPRLLVWDISGYEEWSEGLLLNAGRPRWVLENGAMRRWRDRLVREMAERKGVAFLNELCQSSFQRIASAVTEIGTVVPVPVPMSQAPRLQAVSPDQVIRAVYIGRASPWKVAPAKAIIRDFLSDPRLRLTIVTESAEKFGQMLGGDVSKVDFVEGLTGPELEAFLLAEADLCFGMGTACLEGARLGIPSILCDFARDGSEFPPHHGYRWLFEERGFGLGRQVERMAAVPGTSGAIIIEQLRSASIELGESCWKAAREKFEISHVVDRLLKASQETRFTIDQFRSNPGVRLYQAKRRLVKWWKGARGPEKLLRDDPMVT